MDIKNWKKPFVVMMIGLPGSGKSTWIRENLPGIKVLSTDDFIEQYALSKGKTYSEVFSKAAPLASAKFEQELKKAAKNGESVIIDQTNMGKKSRMNKIAPFKNHYKVAVMVSADPTELMLRLKHRAEKTGKHIPEKVIDQMARSFQTITKDEGWNEIHHINT
jgi:predicted kinase